MTTVLRSRLQFTVHVGTAGIASSGKRFTARVYTTKNCTASRFLQMVQNDRFLHAINSLCFSGDKNEALQLDEKNGGTKQRTLC